MHLLVYLALFVASFVYLNEAPGNFSHKCKFYSYEGISRQGPLALLYHL